MRTRASHPRLAVLFGLILAVALSVGVLGGTLRVMGTSVPLLERWLDWDAVPPAYGLTQADREIIARLISDTMAGRTDTFQYKGLFSGQADVHMRDCTPLFTLALIAGLSGFGLCLAAAGLCALCRSPRGTGIGMLLGAGLTVGAVLTLAVWGLIDFPGLFTAFHRAAFTNDLWLFPPGDLLITLMPLGFFVRCAAAAGILWLASLAAVSGAAVLLIRKDRKKTLP